MILNFFSLPKCMEKIRPTTYYYHNTLINLAIKCVMIYLFLEIYDAIKIKIIYN
jgi:hypothetical protein